MSGPSGREIWDPRGNHISLILLSDMTTRRRGKQQDEWAFGILTNARGVLRYSSVRTREAEDVRRTQVKYNGTTVRQYLIAPSAGITCRLDNNVEGYIGFSVDVKRYRKNKLLNRKKWKEKKKEFDKISRKKRSKLKFHLFKIQIFHRRRERKIRKFEEIEETRFHVNEKRNKSPIFPENCSRFRRELPTYYIYISVSILYTYDHEWNLSRSPSWQTLNSITLKRNHFSTPLRWY